MADSTVVVIEEHPVVLTAGDNTPSRITITDNTTAEVTVLEQVTRVTIHGTSPSLTLQYGGTRGPIYAPGMNFDRKAILAYLIAGVEASHLNLELNEKIDQSSTGLEAARTDLDALIASSGAMDQAIDVLTTSMTQTDEAITQLAQRVTATEAGDIVALQTQITQSADDITLAAARLDTTESNLANAQIQIDAQGIRMSVVENEYATTITSQFALLSNEMTLKIQEDVENGGFYAIGMGAVLTKNWVVDHAYVIDDYVWFNSQTYKAKIAHTSTTSNDPAQAPANWELVPGGVKSQIGFDAEQIYFRTQVNGQKFTPFIIQGDSLYLNGNMVATGSVSAAAMIAEDIYTLNMESYTWSNPLLPGYKFDATTGIAQMRGMVMSFEDLQDKPTLVSLGGETPAGAQAKADAAQTAAEAYANARKVEALAYTDGEITAVEAAAIASANAYADLKKTEAQAYADGIVTAEEARAIADAQAKANAAQTAAQSFATAADATVLSSAQAYSNALDCAALINAKATTISGGKITAKSVSAGQIAGYSLSAIFADMGNITAGQINFGSYTGYAWPAAGLWGAHLSANGLLLGNVNNGSYIQFTNTGYMYAPGITIGGGNATFSGIISGRVVQAANIVVDSLTVTEINGMARISGNRLNIVASGSVFVPNGATVQIDHNLGRMVVVVIYSGGFEITLAGVTTTYFRISNSNDSYGSTIGYAYM